MTITEWCQAAREVSEAHGFFTTPENILERLMLVVTECAEAAEDYRNKRMEHFPEELADICIRTFELARSLGIDLEGAIEQKHAKNKLRPYRHGGKLA